MNRISCIAATLFTASLTLLPGLAQNEVSNNQPLTRSLSANEIRIEAKMKQDFKKGLIDSNQLASFQRDFDGILVKEDSYKAGGLTDAGKKTIETKLCAFEGRLDTSAGGVSTTSESNRVVGPKADKNNAMLDKIAPTE
jgi:hypothetical protein